MRYSPPLVPEIELSFHPDLAARDDVGYPAYFTADWAAGQALARYVLDHAEIVRDKSVLDFGTGAGLVALAAKLAGARRVVGIDRDPRAVEALRRNAAALELEVEALVADPLAHAVDLGDLDVVLAGDVLYQDAIPARVWGWLAREARAGRRVLIADPGRISRPPPGLVEVWQTRGAGGSTSIVYTVDAAALTADDAWATPPVTGADDAAAADAADTSGADVAPEGEPPS